MASLTAFLAQNAMKIENEKYVVSKRFNDEKGNPIPWEIKAITSAEDDLIRRSCMKRVPIVGKKGQTTIEIDMPLYLSKLAVACVVFPNLNDVELQNSYGVMGGENLIKTMLNAGEYNDLLMKIQSINGFDNSMEDLVEEAKN